MIAESRPGSAWVHRIAAEPLTAAIHSTLDLFFHFARAAGLSDEQMEQVRQHLLACYLLVGVDPYAYLG